ncbi:YadA-like family protein [Haemophilus haemolyticus]|uniref:YadA-like family protein n=1 Tax=Haemophilus haemolyticus TaxID=726 RepID=UPI001C52DF3D|nr:YadA-like family protein [Haemophilus haemolyticus]
MGSDTLKRKIINVADGTEDYDAVNVRQLNAVEAKIGGIGNQFTNINNHLDRVDTRMNRVGASAAALASLKHANLGVDDKFAVSVGVGNYKNTQAMAVGAVFKPSENVLLNLSGSMSGSEKMLGAGVSWKFGNKSKPAVSTQSAVNSAEVLQLRQEMLAMQKELAELKKALRK